jgi:hypothetical protein
MRRDMAFSRDAFLDNNGGFSSVRYRFLKKQINLFHSIMIFYKGDGKSYQLRVKSDDQYYSYINPFTTTGVWQEIEIPLKNFYPSFRGGKKSAKFSQDSSGKFLF